MGDSQVSPEGGKHRYWSDSQASEAGDLSQDHSYGKRPKHGEWWSKEVGVRVEIGDDFFPDTRCEGGDDFIFFLESQDEGNNELAVGSGGDSFDVDATVVRDGNVLNGDKARRHAQEQVQHMTILFPLYHRWLKI